ncbi:MAG: GTP-binding protein [Xanthobacteraceae bacterium]
MTTPSPATRLPVTVITGFLGSGKTTLVRHILGNQQGVRTAVIVNELGDIGIDGELIVAADGDMVELANGCICCSMNNDFLDTVFRVLDRGRAVDHLVVETTGVADPLPVVLTFLRSELRERVRVDSIVTVADAGSFCLEAFESTAARNQLRHGDVVLLNKCDLAGAGALPALEASIRTLAPAARILRSTQCRVPLPLVLSVGLFQSDRFFADPDLTEAGRDHAAGHGHGHLAADGFEALSFASERPLAVHKFQDFLERLPDNVYRAKGVLALAESDKRYVFHLVGKRFALDESERDGPAGSKLVLIGRGLDRARLMRALEACLAPSFSPTGAENLLATAAKLT